MSYVWVSVLEASRIAPNARSNIYRWIDKGWIQSRNSSGRLEIMLDELLNTRIHPTLEESLWNQVTPSNNKECWIWQGCTNPEGYGIIRRRIGNGKQKFYPVHRLAYKILIGDIPDGMYVCHHCDNPPCVNPNHLFIGTPSDNIQDCIQKGRFRCNPSRGEANGQSKLSLSQVKEMRIKFDNGVKARDLSEEYGVSDSQIWNIVYRKAWKHVS